MDASLDKESCHPFVAMADVLRKKGLKTPEILAEDRQAGYLLITDFGDNLLLDALTPAMADYLYGKALESLRVLQQCDTLAVPVFSMDVMRTELVLFVEWYLCRHLSLNLISAERSLLQRAFHQLMQMAAAQPAVFMHRDYHSANLMVLSHGDIGILDFQDACRGPVTYDLVSLLRDCYIRWPAEKVQQWVRDWHAESFLKKSVSTDQFLEWFDLMGVQRHLKAVMIFVRKFHRDSDERYLQHVPRTLNYVFSVLPNYPVFRELHDFLVSLGCKTCVE